jgi:hypothetical protein
MDQILKARPRNVQFRHRGSLVPVCYELFKPEVNVALAQKISETYDLKSTGIIVNQSAASTHYLSFRHTLLGDPFRYLDATIGIDQIEVAFFNAATVVELVTEVSRVWKIVIELLRPTIKDNYFEAILHCESESSTKTFLDKLVNIQQDGLDINKGFSISTKVEKIDAIARVGLEVSETISDGLYVAFVVASKKTVRNLADFAPLFETTLGTYRSLQTLAHIELEEPK